MGKEFHLAEGDDCRAVMPLPLTHKDLRSWRAHLRARGGERRYSRNDTCSGAFVPLLLKLKQWGLGASPIRHIGTTYLRITNCYCLLSVENSPLVHVDRSPSPHRHLEHPRQKRSVLILNRMHRPPPRSLLGLAAARVRPRASGLREEPF